MKLYKLLAIVLAVISINSFADDTSDMLGTPDKPQIDGVAYDLHKPYIEPNPGYAAQQQSVAKLATNAQNSPEPETSKKIIVKQANSIQSTLVSDSWATDAKIGKMLKQAASDGKLSYVLDEAKKANVPPVVATVPMAESNYNKKAVSPKGAAGAWQLMPGTANDYGISAQERFNFERSTKAAIELLNDLHQQFGNWNLAFAAYNCGQGCVINALKKNPKATDIDELSLPAETKAYVHHIIRINQVIAGLDNVKN